VKFVDFRFTDPRGKMQHVTMDVSCVDEDLFADGVMFDGSSIAGWKAINESDMVLMPDTDDGCIWTRSSPSRPWQSSATFWSRSPAKPTAAIRAPRPRRLRPISSHPALATPSLARKPSSSSSTTCVQGRSLQHRLQARLLELPTNMDTEYEMGNMGHRPRTKGGYFPVPPVDSVARTFAGEMLTVHGIDGRHG
jgi:glutamine synthetase